MVVLHVRYEVYDLKSVCEDALCNLLDEDSVLCLLGIADQFQVEVFFLVEHRIKFSNF